MFVRVLGMKETSHAEGIINVTMYLLMGDEIIPLYVPFMVDWDFWLYMYIVFSSSKATNVNVPSPF